MVLACKGDLQWALAMDLIREAAAKGLRVRTNHLQQKQNKSILMSLRHTEAEA